MIHPLSLIVACTILLCGMNVAADDGPLEKKLAAAKELYDRAVEKARAGLLTDLKKKEGAAQKTGDLKTLEKVQAEAKAFEETGELPKAVPARGYESQVRTARVRLEDEYESAVKQYTKDGKVALAKAIQQELDEFKKSGPVAAVTATDSFQPKTVWVDDNPRKVLTVTQRKGEMFTATLEIGDKIERVVTGTIRDGKISWMAKDVRVVRGSPGGDNHGTLATDKVGDRIDFVWRGDDGSNGTFSLRLGKHK
jgi:hypothetical protein